MFLIIFVWTPPHFWALALLRADEYARAGVPMLPVVAGDARDAPPDRALFVSCSRRSARCPGCSAMPAWSMARSRSSAVSCSLPPRSRLRGAAKGEATEHAAKALFGYSILYLVLLFAVLLVDKGFGCSFGQLVW